MDHRRRLASSAFAFVATTLCVVLLHDGPCGAAAARPMGRHETTALSEAVLEVAAASPEGATWEGGDEALRAGKWLPLPVANALTGGLRFPAVLPVTGASMPWAAGASMPWAAGSSMPWAAGAPPALAGPGLPLVGATRQEQISLWASLFNPFQVRPRLPAAETSVPAEPRTPAVAGRTSERTTVDEPAGGVQVGEPRWGVFLGNNNGN